MELEELRRRSEREREIFLGMGFGFLCVNPGLFSVAARGRGIVSACRLGESGSCRGVICVEEMR